MSVGISFKTCIISVDLGKAFKHTLLNFTCKYMSSDVDNCVQLVLVARMIHILSSLGIYLPDFNNFFCVNARVFKVIETNHIVLTMATRFYGDLRQVNFSVFASHNKHF